jgi:hypothetical protein
MFLTSIIKEVMRLRVVLQYFSTLVAVLVYRHVNQVVALFVHHSKTQRTNLANTHNIYM